MTNKQIKQFNRMQAALTRIAKHYQTPAQLKRGSNKEYGIDGNEAIEYAYENIQYEAKAAVKGIKPILEVYQS